MDINEEEPRNLRRCRQCRETGHDIRNCPEFEKIHREALSEYNTWLSHCIVDFYTCNKWQYSDEIQAIPRESELLQLFIENRDNENPILTVLLKPTTWLKKQSFDRIKMLAHVFGYQYKRQPYKSFTKDEWIQIIHGTLFVETESRVIRKYSVKEVLPYLASSIQCFSQIESVYNSVYNIAGINNEQLQMFPLKTLEERQSRVRELRNYTIRNLRYIRDDISRNTRDEREIRRRINELRTRKLRVESNRQRLQERMEQYEIEMTMFLCIPPDPPRISFHQKNTLKSIDCPICFESIPEVNCVTLNCNHDFCASCVFNTIVGKYHIRTQELDSCPCPYCRTKITQIHGNVNEIKKTFETICQKKNISEDITQLVGGSSNEIINEDIAFSMNNIINQQF
jgi:hypothetical protein